MRFAGISYFFFLWSQFGMMSLGAFIILINIMFFLTLFFSLLLVLSFFLIENTPTLEKISPFECGFASFSDVFGPFNVQFYFTALYFLVFDLELALILPVIPVLLSLGVFPLVIFFFLLLAMFLCVFYERMCFKLMYKNSY